MLKLSRLHQSQQETDAWTSNCALRNKFLRKKIEVTKQIHSNATSSRIDSQPSTMN